MATLQAPPTLTGTAFNVSSRNGLTASVAGDGSVVVTDQNFIQDLVLIGFTFAPLNPPGLNFNRSYGNGAAPLLLGL